MIRVWLDDSLIREVPRGWVHVITAQECIELFLKEGNKIDACSLDRDLGYLDGYAFAEAPSGEVVVRWMIENHFLPRFINIHSWNQVAAIKMEVAFREAGKVAGRYPYSSDLVRSLEKIP